MKHLMLISAALSLASSLYACSPEISESQIPVPTSQPTAVPVVEIEKTDCDKTPPAGNLLNNGDFESPALEGQQQIFNSGSNFTGWKVELGSVTLFRASLAQPAGAQVLGFAGKVSQSFKSEIGKAYQLSFCYSTVPGSRVGGLVINWNGQDLATLPLEPPAATDSTPVWKGARLSLPNVSGDQSTLSLNGQSAMLDLVRIGLLP